MTLSFADRMVDGFPVTQVTGRLDSSAEGAAQARLLAALQDGRPGLLLDMTDMTYLSSVGLRVLVMVAKRASTLGRPLALCGLQPELVDLLAVSGLDDVFVLHISTSAAVASLARGGR